MTKKVKAAPASGNVEAIPGGHPARVALTEAHRALYAAAGECTDADHRADLSAAAAVVYAVSAALAMGQAGKLRDKLRGASVESWAKNFLAPVNVLAPAATDGALAKQLEAAFGRWHKAKRQLTRHEVAKRIAELVIRDAPRLAGGRSTDAVTTIVYAALPDGGTRSDRMRASMDEVFAEDPFETIRAVLRAVGAASKARHALRDKR